MKQLLSMLLTCISLAAAAQINVKGTDGRIYTIYTKANQDARETATAKQLVPRIDSAIAVAAGKQKIYTDTLVAGSVKRIFLRPTDTLVSGIGIRYDSVGPNKKKATAQIYYDPATNTYKRNW